MLKPINKKILLPLLLLGFILLLLSAYYLYRQNKIAGMNDQEYCNYFYENKHTCPENKCYITCGSTPEGFDDNTEASLGCLAVCQANNCSDYSFENCPVSFRGCARIESPSGNKSCGYPNY